MTTLASPKKRSSWEIQRQVVFALFVREMKTRFGGYWLGAFWLLLEPVAHVAMLLAIRVVLRDMSPIGVQIDLPVWMVVGLMPFLMFRKIWTRVMSAAASNGALFAYRQVKPFDAMVARALLEAMLSMTVLIILLLGLGWLGYTFIPRNTIEYLYIVLMMGLLGTGLGLISAYSLTYFSQTPLFVAMLGMPLYFMSGVIIPIQRLDPFIMQYLLFNPILHLLELARDAFFPRYAMATGVNLEYPAAWAILTNAIGLVLYRIRREQMLYMR